MDKLKDIFHAVINSKIAKQVIQVLIALDQLANTLIGLITTVIYSITSLLGDDFVGAVGWADEAVSARAYRLQDKKFWFVLYMIINGLFFWQGDHCRSSYESEIKRRQLPPEYRKQQEQQAK